MLISILIIGFFFGILLNETNFLRIRLLIGKDKPEILLLTAPKVLLLSAPKKLVKYTVYNKYGNKKPKYDDTVLYEGGNVPQFYYCNHTKHYQVVFNPGITEPLCGYEWLDKHCNAMYDYEPEISMNLADVKYNLKLKQPEIIKDIMRVNKLSKVEKTRIKSL